MRDIHDVDPDDDAIGSFAQTRLPKNRNQRKENLKSPFASESSKAGSPRGAMGSHLAAGNRGRQ